MLPRGGFDFPGLYSVAADLQLAVDPPEVFHVAVAQSAAEIAAAVHPGARLARVGIGNEPRGGHVGQAQVSACDAGAGDTDFSRHAERRQVAARIRDVEPQVVNRPADAGRSDPRLAGDDAASGDMDGGLGDAVHVDQAGRGIRITLAP